MDNLFQPNLTIITFFPVLGGLFVILLSLIFRDSSELLKKSALLISIVEFILSIPLFTAFETDIPGVQFVVRKEWIKTLGISYHMGVDGISLLLILLTTFIFPITILSSWREVKRGIREFLVLMLILETALIGTFAALDMILFFVFWEVVLIPMYFIIGIWGAERRIYAAIKFFIYTAFG
ncbi:MAG: proton-conducting transporter membrane subunit, partial [Thermodesulfobacteriota bacterium]